MNSISDLSKILVRSIFLSAKINKLNLKFAGGFAGVLSWLFTHPQDVVKSRMQAQEGFHSDLKVYVLS